MKGLGIALVGMLAVAGGIAAATIITKKKLEKENDADYYDDWDEEWDDDGADFDFDEDHDLYEVVCPTCGDSIMLNEQMVEEGSMNCPNCGELLEFDLEDEDEEEDSDKE